MNAPALPDTTNVTVDGCLSVISHANNELELTLDHLRNSCPTTDDLSIILYVKDLKRLKEEIYKIIDLIQEVKKIEKGHNFDIDASFKIRRRLRALVSANAILCAQLDQLRPNLPTS